MENSISKEAKAALRKEFESEFEQDFISPDGIAAIERAISIVESFPTSDGLQSSSNVWIPVDEKLPENDGEYCVELNDGRVSFAYFNFHKKWKRNSEDCNEVKKWMPLPIPPLSE